MVAVTVFTLGTGASYESGATLMCNSFDKMKHVIAGDKDKSLQDDLARVIRVVVGLERSAARVNVDTNNVESVRALDVTEGARGLI